MPLSNTYQVANPQALRYADAPTLSWFLGYLGDSQMAAWLDRVILFGSRADGINMEGVREKQVVHEFMVVLDDEASERFCTSREGHLDFMAKMRTAARMDATVLDIDMFVCRKSSWKTSDLKESRVIANARCGVIVAARL